MIGPILIKIFKSFLSKGIVPNDWKVALVGFLYLKVLNVSQVIIDPSIWLA